MKSIPRYAKVIWVVLLVVFLILCSDIGASFLEVIVSAAINSAVLTLIVCSLVEDYRKKNTPVNGYYPPLEKDDGINWFAVSEAFENIGKKEEESQWMVSNHSSFYNQGNITDNVRYVTDRDGNEIRLHKASGAYWDDQGNMYEDMN